VRKVIKGKRPSDARIEAMQLLGQWTSLGQAHVLLGGGCSCGLAAGSLRLDEFEQQILDFLHDKYRASGNEAVTQQLRERAGYAPAKSGSVAALLRSIGAETAGDRASEWLAVLADLKRTLDSFDELHRSR
jgi:hypothetical protein